MGITAFIAIVMMFFVNILPEETQIEAVQSAIFYEKINSSREFDRTKIDLNLISKLA